MRTTNKYKRLASNTLLFAIGSFGSKIILLFMVRLYTNQLSGAQLSTKELLEITANFLIPVVSFSITEAIIRYGLDKKYDNKKVFSNACTVELCGFFILLLISPLIFLLPFAQGYVPLLLIYICTSCFRSLCSQFVRSRNLITLFTLDGILCTLSLCIFNIIFLLGFHMGVRGFMLSVIFSDFLSGLFLWCIADLSKFFSFKNIDQDLIKKMLHFSLPLIPTALLWIITGFSDRLFIIYMNGPKGQVGQTAAGVYGASTKIPNLLSMVSTVIYQAWNMSAITESRSRERNRFYGKVFFSYQSMLFVASAFLIAFSKILSNILLDTKTYPEYAEAFRYTPLLICASTMMCFDQFLSSIYTVTKKTKHAFFTSFVATMANLLLNFILIPFFGVYGAVVATLLSYFICYVQRIYDSRKLIPFEIHHNHFSYNFLILICMSMVIMIHPANSVLLLFLFLVIICILNFKELYATANKLLRR